MKRKRILLIFILLIFLNSCAVAKPYVACSVYPLEYLLKRIGGNKIKPISIQEEALIQVANIKKDYQNILKKSSYFFHIGHLEPYLDIYKKQIKEIKINDVDLSILNAIYKFERYSLVYINGQENYVVSPYYDGEAFERIDTNELDLFLWLDPIGMLSMAKDITKILASNEVETAKEYRDNYRKLESDLIGLDAAYQSLSRKLKKENKTISFVSMTASFGSWQKAYGFQVYPVCLSKYGALPTKAQLEIIKSRIIADKVEYIAYEPNMSAEMKALFEQLESELKLKRVNLSNISSLTATQKTDNKDYLTLMYENLSVLENLATAKNEDNEEKPLTVEKGDKHEALTD